MAGSSGLMGGLAAFRVAGGKVLNITARGRGPIALLLRART
ncbi:hypothetical protein [Novosphingobium humi]|uniref:Uncharacterized protein n=1 Tax=Novosphingobium humi TaxID=2282397 RepID=A0ABY7TWV9_9SPHN|nr:hypothetical protein [Novosphingobium humi]WCT77762.1 hypothetical protein PQ457_01935 [Novosphingobium humi]